MQFSEKMTRIETRATAALASIYGLRMLGMFLILPIFAIYAETLEGGQNHALIGLALGAYGFMQVILQLPFGMASDRFGRKKLIYLGLLLFAIGSVVAASAHDIYMVIIGRSIQGAGAISAVVTALVADSTREEHRTQAMAMIGATIGLTFAVSLVAGPLLNQWIGVSGIFWLTAVLSIMAIFVVKYGVPDPLEVHFHSDAQAAPAKMKEVLHDRQLLRLNFGTFCLHGAQMAMFMVVPFAIKANTGLNENAHWKIYLPVLVISFVLMVPAIIYAEKKAKLKPVFVSAVALMLLTQLAFMVSLNSLAGIVVTLFSYFVAFNILEASLPSLISKMAPVASKGTAMGVHNTAQSFGMFLGATMGGWLSHHYGNSVVFLFCAGLMTIWLLLALGMQAPPSVKTKMFHIQGYNDAQAAKLAQDIRAMEGVYEVVAIPTETMLMVKLENQRSKEFQAALSQAIMNRIGS
ncbi:MFS transporter [Methylophilus aquaticus]|uniref:MFS transporter n=1 Tax=Methylophilus aquaticus TaxID=1971610 RepID=A0ABT9JWJ1_9PROT|nr:MFS transporter [Methylophilus aquaticus]MDP8568912.1 MFS transporter [Methylophilus aquaticus]